MIHKEKQKKKLMFNEGLYVVDKYRAKHYMQFF